MDHFRCTCICPQQTDLNMFYTSSEMRLKSYRRPAKLYSILAFVALLLMALTFILRPPKKSSQLSAEELKTFLAEREAVYKRRKARIRRKCERYQYQDAVNERKHYVVNNDTLLYYCCVGKVAGGTWRSNLALINGMPDWEKAGEKRRLEFLNARKIFDVTQQHIEAMNQSGSQWFR